jgi:hypothetical protein
MSGWLGKLFPSRPKVGPVQARELLDQGAILLDVREDAEWGGRARTQSQAHPAEPAPGPRPGPATQPHRGDRVPLGRPVRPGSRAAGPRGP